ncbi:2417_t:CDS:2 [Dentiscutata erythropus]|uniref:2417_t:CDS:1 n=1 Tax=Dentiscutata erythropus TaxID=1348616 RepID=A0A9N9C756_9GLOM|nr:2417_t:CDS:2 [Dentiscutata erythropus]
MPNLINAELGASLSRNKLYYNRYRFYIYTSFGFVPKSILLLAKLKLLTLTMEKQKLNN